MAAGLSFAFSKSILHLLSVYEIGAGHAVETRPLVRNRRTRKQFARQAIRFVPILLPISPCHSPCRNPQEVDNPAFGNRPAIAFPPIFIVEIRSNAVRDFF